MSDRDRLRLIESRTRRQRAPLVPEIELHLHDDLTVLWEELESLQGNEIPPPFWAACWPGGQVLARHLLDHPGLVRDQRVLDFATGSGVSAIAAALSGAGHVLATEIDPLAAAAARLNAALNHAAIEVSHEDVVDTDQGWSTVLAGDVCYEAPMARRITRWLRGLAARGATVLLGDPGRTWLPSEGLEPLHTYAVPVSLALEDREIRETTLWRVAG